MGERAMEMTLKLHAAWLRDEPGGVRADLRGADLTEVNLPGADLREAELRGADLSRADLSRANLSGADLSWADLSRANLSGADLSGADLSEAVLYGANLAGVNLSRANLSGANLYGVDLYGALYSPDTVWPDPEKMLLVNWETVSDDLCRDLMRYDAAHHPDGDEPFTEWAMGGDCPYSGIDAERVANFQERKTLWAPGPAPSAAELVKRLLEEKTVRS
jgi:uncharacterized protein YjbI with pentapeptide repeats